MEVKSIADSLKEGDGETEHLANEPYTIKVKYHEGASRIGSDIPRCKEVFQVSTFEHDEDFVVGAGRDFFECVPSYCPICGHELEYEQ